jgi:hypothetical protein
MKFRDGQSAVEFMILVGAVLFFFLGMLFVIQGNIGDKLRENKNIVLQEIAISIQKEINLASESSDGYKRDFTILPNILGLEYSLCITDGLVYVATDNGKHAIALPVEPVDGNLKDEPEVDNINTIEKINGEVVLNGGIAGVCPQQ